MNQNWFRTTFYSIGDGVITCDLDGRVRQMNPVAERLTGWAEDETAAMYQGSFQHRYPETEKPRSGNFERGNQS